MTPDSMRPAALAGAVLLLAGCASLPAGPSLPAMPGSRASPEQFNADDARCRGDATARLGTTPTDAANQSAVASTVAGTAIGAATGALMGGNYGGRWGAGMGMLFGATAGIGASQTAYAATQRQFDALYFECMYTAGHKVPAPASNATVYRSRQEAASVPAPRTAAPPHLPPPDYRPEGPPKQ